MKHELNTIEDFLINDSFIRFVFEQTSSLKEYWDSFFRQHPDKEPVAKEAEHILLYELDAPGITLAEQEKLKEKILADIK